MQKTAIVIGATGLIGKHVVRSLVEAKQFNRVLTITRRPVEYESNKVENQVVEFARLAEHADLFKGDVLFSCLGTTLRQAGSIEAQRVVDLDYQYTAAKLALEQGVRDYCLVSSNGANAQSMSSYLKMKGELEERVADLSFDSISIFQPSLLLGQRDHHRFAEGLASKVMPVLCQLPGLRRYRPIRGAQVAQRMVEMSVKPTPGLNTITLDDVFPEN